MDKSLKAKLKKYDLTEDEYKLLLKRSGNVCEICFNPPKTKALCIDHNHKTGKVRGLLCFQCNKILIGRMGDRKNAIELFTKALEYLKKNG